MIIYKFHIFKNKSGQAMVESAIVLPMFIFLMLGILQLGLIYQARYLLEYAAYNAARTGALRHADTWAMKEAASAVMVPVMAANGVNPRADDRGRYNERFTLLSDQERLFSAYNGLSLIRVVICGPQRGDMSGAKKIGNREVDFDGPTNVLWSDDDTVNESSSTHIKKFLRTKLRIQVQYYQQLIIPFANMIIFRIFIGKDLMKELRMQPTTGGALNSNYNLYRQLAIGVFQDGPGKNRPFLPLHANYSFRMQSNLMLSNLPSDNSCINGGWDRAL